MAIAGKTVFAQFTQARSIHRGFYKWKTMDDYQKKFIPQLVQNIFIAHLPILVRCKTKGEVGAVCAAYCAIGNSVPETGKKPLEWSAPQTQFTYIFHLTMWL